MKKAALFTLFCIFVLSSIMLTKPHANLEAAASAVGDLPQFTLPTKGVFINRDVRNGRISTGYQAVLGPLGCIADGDPYSPINSPFASGSYTYTYLIRIPSNYPSDVVRVELFDPDSINTELNSLIINRSNVAITEGLNTTALKTCGSDGGSSNQTETCALSTDERTLVTGSPNLDFDQINPHWFVRVDRNRIQVNPTVCGFPESYISAANTQTLYTLYYFAQNPDETPLRVPLVAYAGQTGDNLRDTGDHLTDLRWVSPGANQPFSPIDTPGVTVPAIPQNIDSFEVDLTTDLPNIIKDTLTGDRFLYLDIQTLSGASENGFDIWAGPPIYTDGDSSVPDVPSDVNNRNLFILNNPGAHDAAGVEILALGSLPQTRAADYPIDIPLFNVGPESIGQTIQVRLFDSDAGAQPPIVFYFDTIGFTPDTTNPLGYDPVSTDWAMAFSVAGQDDPDGVAEGVRCVPGSCNSQWINPAYQITVPGDLSDCNYANPTMADCTPFYGGRLMAHFNGGINDMHTWEMSIPQEPVSSTGDTTAGCTAFPIGINEAARSVTAPGTGNNPYPDVIDFSYPPNPPVYASFLDHQDDMPLLNATPGDIYRVQNGFGNGNFGWLVWNTGISANSSTLVNSLTWPGDTLDYTNHPDGGTAVPGSGFPYVVRGYIEPGDPTDQALQINDWIAAMTGSVNINAVGEQLNAHIDLGRTLRLPIWSNSIINGADSQYQTSQFAIFRLIGYNMTENWLLLEFVGFDASCGQLSAAPTAVSLTGPTTGETNTSYNFTADVSPSFTTTPITYTWKISDQETITNTDGISNTVTLEWSSTGSKTVTVTAVNSTGLSASQSHVIDIDTPKQLLYLPILIKAETE